MLPAQQTAIMDDDFNRRFMNLIIRSNKKDSGKEDEKTALLNDEKDIARLHAGNFKDDLQAILKEQTPGDERKKILFENREQILIQFDMLCENGVIKSDSVLDLYGHAVQDQGLANALILKIVFKCLASMLEKGTSEDTHN